MALPDYFQRSAVAAAQILSGFDEQAIRRRLEGVTVGVAYSAETARSPEGRSCIEMTVRLLARLYPTLRIAGPEEERWVELAREINPQLEFTVQECDLALRIGHAATIGRVEFRLGSDGWNARFSTREDQLIGETPNPLGGGVAACLGAAAVFRSLFLDETVEDGDLVFSTLELEPRASTAQPSLEGVDIPPRTVLVGLGAVGSAAVWALARSEACGSIHLVDPEALDAGNLQRYVTSRPGDVDRSKVEIGAEALEGSLDLVVRHTQRWDEFVSDEGRRWERVLVAVDSGRDRRAVQATLPRWIANAWTQPGDLGMSVHPWRYGACLACLYLPEHASRNEDELVAAAMGFDDERHLRQVRSLLVSGEPPPPELLREAAAALDIEPEPLLAYCDRPLRDFYVEGVCGGAAVPLDRISQSDRSVHVPLAHQSALAGLLLVAGLYADLLDHGANSAQATRIDLMGGVAEHPTQPIGKDSRGICICQDAVYQAAYDEKWSETAREG